jgi:hypothetical protein
MHVSTAGTPAWRERSAPVWQYWQGMWLSPACSLWEKAMGCVGEYPVAKRSGSVA